MTRLQLETTRACTRAPMILFLLEELGVECELVVREPGYFQAHHHTAGPALVDGDLVVLELDAVLRHLARGHGDGALLPTGPGDLAQVDRWMELQATARVRLVAGGVPFSADALAAFARHFDALEAALVDRDYLLGRFTVADCAAATIAHVARAGHVRLTDHPRLAGYVERLTSRPAWRRAMGRAAATAPRAASARRSATVC